MTRLWEENKPLIFVMGACILLLVVVRPNLFSLDPPLAGWMGASWSAQHADLQAKRQQFDSELEDFAASRDAERISEIQARVKGSNKRLKQNYDQYVHSLIFVPHRPFVLPKDEEKGEPGHYFRAALTDARIRLLRYCSFRDVTVAEDLGFGEWDKEGEIPKGAVVHDLLRQLAVTETFVKLCADSQVRFTRVVEHKPKVPIQYPGEEKATRPRRWKTKSRKKKSRRFLTEHPMRVKLVAGFPQLMKLLRSLNGLQARVKDAPLNEVRYMVEKVTLDIGSADGVRNNDQFTIFKRTPGKPCAPVYAGRVTVTKVMPTQCIARVDEKSLPSDPFDPDRKESLRIRQGDYATSGFFRVLRVNMKALPGKIEGRDENGIPVKVVPHLLDVAMDLSTVSFDPKTEYITAKNVSKVTGLKLESTRGKKQASRSSRVHAGPSF